MITNNIKSIDTKYIASENIAIVIGNFASVFTTKIIYFAHQLASKNKTGVNSFSIGITEHIKATAVNASKAVTANVTSKFVIGAKTDTNPNIYDTTGKVNTIENIGI